MLRVIIETGASLSDAHMMRSGVSENQTKNDKSYENTF